MKRKVPRSHRLAQQRAEPRAAETPQPPVAAAPAASEPARPRRHSASSLLGLAQRLLLLAALTVFVGLILLWISVWLRADVWPTRADTGLQWAWAAGQVGLLLLAAGSAWLGARLVRSATARAARLALLVAVLCGAAAIGLRWHEYQQLRTDGLWQRSVARPLFQQADLHYLQAVRQRLTQLGQQLDTRREQQPDAFSDEDGERLARIDSLTQDMVVWTEQQVGHWLDDLQQRRAALRQVAFLVFPREADREAVLQQVQAEQRELVSQRQWFELLLDYCQRKSQLGADRPEDAAAADGDLAGTGDPEAWQALDNQLAQKLESLGLARWPYAQSVMADTRDVAMVGERVNQLKIYLAAMSRREAFLRDVVLPVADSPDALGLNRQHQWLQLPVCLPGGNAWAGGYFALTSLHLLLTAFVTLISLVPLLTRPQMAHWPAWRLTAWWWTLVSLVSAAVLVLCYLV